MPKVHTQPQEELDAARVESLLTPKATRAALSISSTTEFRLNKTGQLVPLYLGKSKRYRASDIRDIISGKKEVA